MVVRLCLLVLSRTPPGVRELKLSVGMIVLLLLSRTPPGVRELKLLPLLHRPAVLGVAPLPGCVN